MRRIYSISLLFSLLLVVIHVSYAQSRPRRVDNTSTNPSSQPSTRTTPPVLAGEPPPLPTRTPTAASANPEEIAEGDVLRISTNLVTVPVSVMDRNGRYIPNLRKEDFKLFENGTEHHVAYFSSVDKPFTVALLIDTSGSTNAQLFDMQSAAIAFVEQLRPEDRVIVISFDDRIRVLSEATNDRFALRSAIRQSETGGGTRLYDALDLVIKDRLNRIDGRKAIVLFTDGVDTTSRRASLDSTLRDAEELDVLIYSVQYDTYADVAGSGGGSLPPVVIYRWPFPFPIPNTGGRRSPSGQRGTRQEDYELADQYLGELAERTGARRYRADGTRNIAQAFSMIAEELRRQYSVGYYPTIAPQAGERRQIRVRVNQPNLVVRARNTIVFGSSAGQRVAQDGETQRRPELKRQ